MSVARCQVSEEKKERCVLLTFDSLLLMPKKYYRMIKNFKNLSIWKRSRSLVKSIYLATNDFPKNEMFGLISQIRRAAISIPSNIAEGCGRTTNKELSRFLDISIGSICEIETQLYLAFDFKFISKENAKALIDEIVEIRKMIIGFQKTL